MQWTEPKDGLPETNVPVLVAITKANGRLTCLRAEYARPFTLPIGLDQDDSFGEYDEATDEFYCPEGWYEANQYEDIHWKIEDTVAFWTYMPQPPDVNNLNS